MATVDSTSVPRVTAALTGIPSTLLTTAPFTPPSGSLLVVALNTDTAADVTLVVTASGGQTCSLRVERDPGDAGASQGHASVWTIPIVSGASMTVSAQFTAGSGGTGQATMKVYIVTGQAASPIGAVGEGSSAANNLAAAAYTSTANNSRGFGCATDWNQLGIPTSTDTEDGVDIPGAISAVSLYKAADTPTSGTAVTMNFDAGGAGAAVWNWVALEILSAAGGTPSGSATSTSGAASTATGRRVGQRAATSTAGAASVATGGQPVITHSGSATTSAGATSTATGRRVSRSAPASTAGAASTVTTRRVSQSSHEEVSAVPPFTIIVAGVLTVAAATSTASGTASTVPTHSGTATTSAGAASTASGRRKALRAATSSCGATSQATARRRARGTCLSSAGARSFASGAVPAPVGPRVRVGRPLSGALEPMHRTGCVEPVYRTGAVEPVHATGGSEPSYKTGAIEIDVGG